MICRPSVNLFACHAAAARALGHRFFPAETLAAHQHRIEPWLLEVSRAGSLRASSAQYLVRGARARAGGVQA